MSLRSLVLAIFLSYSAFGAVVNERKYDTIVIGLGPSGAMAAGALGRLGLKVLALEAQDRIGGRVYTRPFGDGVVEVGAEWIHGIENSITYAAAKNKSIDIKIQEFGFVGFLSNGSSADNELLKILMEMVDPTVEPDHPPQPLGEYITANVKEYLKKERPEVLQDPDYLAELLDILNRSQVTADASDDWRDVSTAGTYEDLGGSKLASWHRHGYKTLFDILLNKYGDEPGLPTLEVKLNTEVTKVKYTNDSVQVTTKNGDTYTADNVIVTVSIGVLKERHADLFDPSLPEEKVTAIEKISIGVVDKVILAFNEAWWPRNKIIAFVWRTEDRKKVSQEDSWLMKVFGASSSMGASNVLEFWITGEAAKKMETLPESEVQSKMMWLVRMFMGKDKVIPDPVAMLRSTWFTNPYTRGSYTYANNETPKYPHSRDDLLQPISDANGVIRVLFGGEAVNKLHYATVHGAVEMGFDAARRLLSVRIKDGRFKI